jgi:hypothetical protein
MTGLLACNRGSTLIFFGFAMALIIILFTAVIDMGRIYAAQGRAQAASDAALLGAATIACNADIATQQARVQEEARRLFAANYEAGYLGTSTRDHTVLATQASIDSCHFHYQSRLMLRVPTIIAGVFSSDFTDIPIISATIVKPATAAALELAMVLDNSGSMTGDKIASLQRASRDLVNILFGTAESLQNLHVSVIPYDIVVGIGHGRRDWIQQPSLLKYDQMDSGMMVQYNPGSGEPLRPSRTAYAFNRFTDVLCGPYDRDVPRFCIPAHVERHCSTETNTCEDVPVEEVCYTRLSDDTCVPNGLEDVSDAPPTSPENKFRLPYEIIWFRDDADRRPDPDRQNHLYTTRLAPMLFASNSKVDVLEALQNMRTSGNTRIPVGLMWGWFTLSPRWQGLWDARPNLPLSPVPNLTKAIILMTDGKNIWEDIDDPKTTQLCEAIKNQGILVYTVGFGTGSDINEPLLQNCATSPAHYFLAPTEEDLRRAFRRIADEISSLSIRLNQ